MKILIRILLIIVLIIVLLAVSDTLYNGLMNKDDYKPVTQQMKEVQS